jgi:hypothetical protein
MQAKLFTYLFLFMVWFFAWGTYFVMNYPDLGGQKLSTAETLKIWTKNSCSPDNDALWRSLHYIHDIYIKRSSTGSMSSTSSLFNWFRRKYYVENFIIVLYKVNFQSISDECRKIGIVFAIFSWQNNRGNTDSLRLQVKIVKLNGCVLSFKSNN